MEEAYVSFSHDEVEDFFWSQTEIVDEYIAYRLNAGNDGFDFERASGWLEVAAKYSPYEKDKIIEWTTEHYLSELIKYQRNKH